MRRCRPQPATRPARMVRGARGSAHGAHATRGTMSVRAVPSIAPRVSRPFWRDSPGGPHSSHLPRVDGADRARGRMSRVPQVPGRALPETERTSSLDVPGVRRAACGTHRPLARGRRGAMVRGLQSGAAHAHDGGAHRVPRAQAVHRVGRAGVPRGRDAPGVVLVDASAGAPHHGAAVPRLVDGKVDPRPNDARVQGRDGPERRGRSGARRAPLREREAAHRAAQGRGKAVGGAQQVSARRSRDAGRSDWEPRRQLHQQRGGHGARNWGRVRETEERRGAAAMPRRAARGREARTHPEQLAR